MANAVTTQILIDGPRNCVVKVAGVLDTSDVSYTSLIDPANLGPLDPWGAKASQLRLNRISFNVEDLLDVKLFWDATTPVLIDTFVGRGVNDCNSFGGLINNSTTGKTGKIGYSTEGWTSGSKEFTLILEMVKQ